MRSHGELRCTPGSLEERLQAGSPGLAEAAVKAGAAAVVGKAVKKEAVKENL